MNRLFNSVVNIIGRRIDIFPNNTPLGRWKNVGKSCDIILSKKINTKYRTLIKKNNLLKTNIKTNTNSNYYRYSNSVSKWNKMY